MSAARTPLTSVIIPCWNALDLTRACLRQLLRCTTRPFEVIAVDNGSTDGTGPWLDRLRRSCEGSRTRTALRSFRVITNRRNLGYPKAMNQGIAAAEGALIVFGNNDVAVTPGWLEDMTRALRSRRGVGGVTPASNPLRRPGSSPEWRLGSLYRGLRGLERFAAASAPLRRSLPCYVPADGLFPGYWFLAKRAAVEAVGSFDARFSPGGFEDLDYQFRMRRAGYETGLAAWAYVHHIGFGCAQKNGLRREDLYGSAQARRFHRKFAGAAEVEYSESPFYWAARARS